MCFIFKSLVKYLSGGRIRITSRARFTSVASRLFTDGRNRDLSFSLASAGCNRVDIGPPRKSPASTRVLFGLLHLAVLFHHFVIPLCHPYATLIYQTRGWRRENSHSIYPIAKQIQLYAQIIITLYNIASIQRFRYFDQLILHR